MKIEAKWSDGDRKPGQTILSVGHGSLSSGALYRLVACYPVTIQIYATYALIKLEGKNWSFG